MADGDRGAKDCVEGFDPREKKPLEKVSAPARLQELKKEQKQLEVKVKKELENEQKKMMDLQNKLNDCNKEYADRKRELDELRAVQNEKLTPSQQLQITRLANRTADSFLQRRPRHEELGSEEKTVDVDVHYLPSMEAGLSLRIGGEGAGSRDAKFPVKLSENVKTLAKRAATYWGLDADKVFFLDRDGRIVFEDMSLREIILPPVHHSSSSSYAAAPGALPLDNDRSAQRDSARGSVVRFNPEDSLEVADPAMEQWTVKGRNYNLTLVRAVLPGEMPSTANANKPKGDAWQDFTFDQKKLAQDLKDTLAKYGDPEFEDSKIEMEDIPSLYDLIETGKKKKAQKRADTACRAAEFLIFFVAFCAFQYLMLPTYAWSVSMRLVSRGLEQSLNEFNNGERLALGVDDYSMIASERQFKAWVEGPLMRSVASPGLQSRNLFVLSTQGIRFQAPSHTVDPPKSWCPAPSPAAVAGGLVGGVNASLNMSNATNGTNGTNATNATIAPAAGSSSSAVSLGPDGCSPDSLKSCLNTRVVDVFTTAIRDGDTVPPCKPVYSSWSLLLWWESLMTDDFFTLVSGEVSSYYGGSKTLIDTENATTYNDSVSGMLQHADVNTPARMFMLFVYTPSLNGLFIYKMLVENTLSGGLLASRTLQVLSLDLNYEASFSIHVTCITLAFICFLMEVRRIMGCPKRCTFENKRDHCSCWTFIFLLVPIAMVVSLAVYSARFVYVSENSMEMDLVTKSLSNTSIENLHEMHTLEYYNRLMNLVVLVLLNMCLFRFLLTYFPQLSFLTAMVGKLVKPLWYTFIFLVLSFLVYSSFLYVMYSAQNASFRNFVVTIAQAIRFAQGGVSDWYELYSEYATLYTIVNLLGFIFIHLMLSSMPLAVMLSHKKEKDLRQNYSYHRFWAAEISKMGKSKGEFNPAFIGEKEKDAKEAR